MNYLVVAHRIVPFFLQPKDKKCLFYFDNLFCLFEEYSNACQQSVMVQVLPLKTE